MADRAVLWQQFGAALKEFFVSSGPLDETQAEKLVAALVQEQGSAFYVDPLPDGQFEVFVKKDHGPRFSELVAEARQPQSLFDRVMEIPLDDITYEL